MRSITRIVFFLFSLQFIIVGHGKGAHKSEIDSLLKITENGFVADTIKIDNFYKLASLFVFEDPDSAEYFVERGLELSQSIAYLDGLGQAYGWLGYLNSDKGDLGKAINYNLKSLEIVKIQGLKEEYPVILNNLAQLHSDLENYEQAFRYLLECVTLNIELGKEVSLSTNYANIGAIYRLTGELDSSLVYFNKSLEIRILNGYKKGIASNYLNMGHIYVLKDSLDVALEYYLNALEINESENISKGIAGSLYNIGKVYLNKGELIKAEEYAMRAHSLAKEWQYKYVIKESAKTLYKVYKVKNDKGKALSYFEIYFELHDSINSLENQEAILKSQYQFEYNNKYLVDSLENDRILVENKLLDKENRVKETQLSVQRLWLVVSILGLIILIGLLFLIRKNAQVKMKDLRSEIRLRLNETLQLKNQLESQETQSKLLNIDLNFVLHDKLTEREQEILDELTLGLSNKEIAQKLFLSVNTIKTHILSLYVKLDVKNRTQAAIRGSFMKIQENKR